MGIKRKSGCVGCAVSRGFCMSGACPIGGSYTVLECDLCTSEQDELWYVQGDYLCLDCIKDAIDKATDDDPVIIGGKICV